MISKPRTSNASPDLTDKTPSSVARASNSLPFQMFLIRMMAASDCGEFMPSIGQGFEHTEVQGFADPLGHAPDGGQFFEVATEHPASGPNPAGVHERTAPTAHRLP